MVIAMSELVKKPSNVYGMILTEYKDLLSVKDLMNIFGASQQTIYKKMKGGEFGNPIKIGRAYKIPKLHLLNKFFSG